MVDASPIGRTPRSNPATYIKVLSPIRDLFAALPEARMRGYTKSHFSFNVEGGRCEACGGAGATQVELQFLAPVTVPCDECGGKRFQDQVLDVRYKQHSIADVLALPAEDALELFEGHPLITRSLPSGRIIRRRLFAGSHPVHARWNMGKIIFVIVESFGSHARGDHGTDDFPSISSTQSTADLMPSSWNPYPHHAPQNHILSLP